MSQRLSSAHPGGLELDAFAVDEALDVDGRVRIHQAECDGCRARIGQFRSDGAQFSATIFERSLPEVKRRLLSRGVDASGAWKRVLWVALPVAAGVALASIGPLRGAHHDPHPAIVMKGDPGFALYLRRAGRVTPILSGADVAPGDEVRFVVRPSGFHYLLVASIDAAGHTNVYYPYGGVRSGSIQDADEVTVPGSIVLDATPGPERLFALFSQRPVEAADILEPLHAIGRLGRDGIRSQSRLDAHVEAQSSVLLENGGTPVAP